MRKPLSHVKLGLWQSLMNQHLTLIIIIIIIHIILYDIINHIRYTCILVCFCGSAFANSKGYVAMLICWMEGRDDLGRPCSIEFYDRTLLYYKGKELYIHILYS